MKPEADNLKQATAIDEVALFELITSEKIADADWQRVKHLYADDNVVAAWYDGQAIYCQRVRHPLDQSHAIANAQVALANAGAFASLDNIDEVLKMPCLKTTLT